MTQLSANSQYVSGDLILGALKLMGIEEAGETSTPEDMADGLFVLNLLLDEMSIDRGKIYARTEDTLILTAGKSAYTIGPGAELDTITPVKIEQSFIRDLRMVSTSNPKGLDYWVYPDMSQEDYNMIPVKDIQTIPTRFYCLKQWPLWTITFNYAPIYTYELHLFSWKPLNRLTDTSTQLLLPVGYEAMLTYNLAVAFSAAFGREIRPEVAARAEKLSRAVDQINYEIPKVRLQGIPGSGTDGRGSIYNPFSRG
jgi:hypothetical protein